LKVRNSEIITADETDYLATATVAPAGKPDTDLEIAAPILTEPNMSQSSEQLTNSADGSMGKIGRGRIWISRFNQTSRCSHAQQKNNYGERKGCGLGAARAAPNKKRLAQLFAQAPSPSSLLGGEKSP
jgi:hypothetical protein